MRFTSRSMSDSFNPAGREMSKSHLLGFNTSVTSSQALLVNESSEVLRNFYGHPSQNSSRNLFFVYQRLNVAFARTHVAFRK
jgi:hypothetical protein